MSILRKLFRKPIILIPTLVIAGGILILIFFGNKKSASEEIAVKRGTITQEVSVTGKTKPAENVDLAFEKTGKIAVVNVKIGDKVFLGQTLAALDTGELAANLRQTEAKLETEQAKLNELLRGERPEEIRIGEVKVENAKVALGDAQENSVDKIADAYTKTDDAVRNKVDQFFSNPRSINPQISFAMNDPALEQTVERERLSIEQLLTSWKPLVDKLSTASDLAQATREAKSNLDTIKSFLDHIALALNSLSTSSSLTQATIDGYRSDVSTARTNINTARTNLSAAEEKLRTAGSNLTLAENELALKLAGSTDEEIAAAKAQVKQAEAEVTSSQAQLNKAVLRAPINGIVTKQEAKVGEIVAANAILVSIISESNLEIESNVPEVDIGKVQVTNPVSITLDAFPGETFSGVVSYIDPGETIVDGVVNFKVTVLFNQADKRFKSGLTANLNIETLSKSDTLILPQFAIIENDQGTFVKKVEGGETKEIPVKVGIRGQDGNVEILEGLAEGDKVLNIGFKTASK